ncbi:hypothetical protein KIV56_04535 [Cryobacterium breve]|uniref:Uncharacterized protein n=1 Tax=Cryobacterium breve TaxID=1259258 RepID=A0ABY7NDV3_9MICO|nr:hypothetical protein [Cryobacterium breve]WBM80670.1 hypothetical protein KIV56_04535 [Cryobacterium breve]
MSTYNGDLDEQIADEQCINLSAASAPYTQETSDSYVEWFTFSERARSQPSLSPAEEIKATRQRMHDRKEANKIGEAAANMLESCYRVLREHRQGRPMRSSDRIRPRCSRHSGRLCIRAAADRRALAGRAGNHPHIRRAGDRRLARNRVTQKTTDRKGPRK